MRVVRVWYLHRGRLVLSRPRFPRGVFIAAASILLRGVFIAAYFMSASSIVSFRVRMLSLLFHSAREHVVHRRRMERKWVQLLLQLAEAGELEVLDDRRSRQTGV